MKKKRLWKRKLLSAKNHNQFQLSYKRKRVLAQKKKEHRKIMKKKIKGKKEMAHQYFINFEPFYCNVTAIYDDLFYFLYSCEKARKYSR